MTAPQRLRASETTANPVSHAGGRMRMMWRMIAVVSVLAIAQSVHAQGDPNVGTWKLNLAKSKYNAGSPPKSGTVVVAAAGQGIKVSADNVLADGKSPQTPYTRVSH